MPVTHKKGGVAGRRTTRSKMVTSKVTAHVLSGYFDAIKRVEHTGKPVRVTFVVKSSKAEPQVEFEDVTPAKPDVLDLALGAAKARGAARIAEILKGPEMLSADQFADEIGATRETVNRKRRRHEILGLEGAKRGVRFPRWQLGKDGELIEGLPKLFDALGGRPWAVYRFLLQHHGELNGNTGLDIMRAGRFEDAVAAAQSASRGNFS